MARTARLLNLTMMCALALVGLQFLDASKNANDANVFGRYLTTQAQAQAQTEAQTQTPVRLLSFGTSRAWGAGLKDRFQAYPYLLSKDVKNLAIRATGSDYPSTCTYSMVGDGTYDCILIEFNHVSDEENQFQNLALKLRKRFPRAKIIFIKSWSPFQYIHSDLRQSACGVKDHMFSRDLRRTEASEDVWRRVLENSTSAMWQFMETKHSARIIHDTARMVGGLVWEFPRLPDDHIESMKRYGPMFLHDCNHYSVKGHEFIRDSIEQLVNSAIRSDEVGTWERLDQCDKYFESGEISNETSTDMKIVEFQKDKFALEVAPTGSFLYVPNRLPKPVQVHLNYMVTGPEKIYPTVNISLNGQATVLNPTLTEALDHPVHIVRMQLLGSVGAGEVAKIHLTPIQTQQQPFRVVGISMLEAVVRNESRASDIQPPTLQAVVDGARPVSQSDVVKSKEEEAITDTTPFLQFGPVDTLENKTSQQNDLATESYSGPSVNVGEPSDPVVPLIGTNGRENSIISNLSRNNHATSQNETAIVGDEASGSFHANVVPVERAGVLLEQQHDQSENLISEGRPATQEGEIVISTRTEESPEQRGLRKVAQARDTSTTDRSVQQNPDSIVEREGKFVDTIVESADTIRRRLTLADPKTVQNKETLTATTASQSESQSNSLPLCPKKEKKKKSLTAVLDEQAGKQTAAPVPCVLSAAPSRSPVTPSPTWAPVRPTPVKKKKKMGLSGLLGGR